MCNMYISTQVNNICNKQTNKKQQSSDRQRMNEEDLARIKQQTRRNQLNKHMGIRRHGKKHQSDNHTTTANCEPFCTHNYLMSIVSHVLLIRNCFIFFTNNYNVNNSQQTTKTRNLKQLFITFNTNKHIITIMKSFNL